MNVGAMYIFLGAIVDTYIVSQGYIWIKPQM